jgi:uncharacterized protein
MKFVIRLSKNTKFYFVLKARNGEVIAVSEMYESKQGCRKGIRAIRKMLFSPLIDETGL